MAFLSRMFSPPAERRGGRGSAAAKLAPESALTPPASLSASAFRGRIIKEGSLLARRAVEGRAAILHDALDDARAVRRDAALALAIIDAEMVLEIAEIAVRPLVVAQ